MALIAFTDPQIRYRFACDANVSNLCMDVTEPCDSKEHARSSAESLGWVIVLEGGLGKNLRAFCPKCMSMIREL